MHDTRPRALITGAARRVGRAIAIELAPYFDLALHTRSSDLGEVTDACEALGAQVIPLQADLASLQDTLGLVEELRASWDSLHLLVNNASLFEPVPFAEISLEAWQSMQDVNLRAPFLLSQRLLPLLLAADGVQIGAPEGQRAVVVHIGDIGGDRPSAGYTHYSVSKAGLLMLVKAMAVELAPEIRTVGISPGQVAWPEAYGPAKRERIARRIPLGRAGTPEDIAKAVRFLTLDAHYVNGAIWAVDGGLQARY